MFRQMAQNVHDGSYNLNPLKKKLCFKIYHVRNLNSYSKINTRLFNFEHHKKAISNYTACN